MSTAFRYDSKVRATCAECGHVGTPWQLELHSCDIAKSFGGRCEDYPCCGHTDGDGCQTLPQHTSAYWSQVIADGKAHLMYEPGSPEWYDALDDAGSYDDGDRDDEEEEEDDGNPESGSWREIRGLE